MKTGIHPDVPMAEYLAAIAFSGGMANTILSKSPLHAWTDSPWNPARERGNSKVADIGTTMHDMLLGGEDKIEILDPEDYPSKTKTIPKGYTNDAIRAARDAAYAAGKTPILLDAYTEAQDAVEAALRFVAKTELAGIFDAGESEQTVYWEDAGVPCKARPDRLSADQRIHLSVKTTAGSAQPDAWIRTQLPQYDTGMIHYERGIRAAGGPQDVRSVVLVVEQAHPFGCSLIALAPAWQELAEARYMRALHIWAECLKTGKFPGYQTAVCHAEPKPWQVAEVEEAELAGIEFDPAKMWGKEAA